MNLHTHTHTHTHTQWIQSHTRVAASVYLMCVADRLIYTTYEELYNIYGILYNTTYHEIMETTRSMS